jgi:hypothetical protein
MQEKKYIPGDKTSTDTNQDNITPGSRNQGFEDINDRLGSLGNFEKDPEAPQARSFLATAGAFLLTVVVREQAPKILQSVVNGLKSRIEKKGMKLEDKVRIAGIKMSFTVGELINGWQAIGKKLFPEANWDKAKEEQEEYDKEKLKPVVILSDFVLVAKDIENETDADIVEAFIKVKMPNLVGKITAEQIAQIKQKLDTVIGSGEDDTKKAVAQEYLNKKLKELLDK